MAEGKVEPTSNEEQLPEAGAPNFDLSDESLEADGNGVSVAEQAEIASQGEPEGIFALFDREFPEEAREPIPAEESSEFDREFSESFETMFTAVKGDGSAPLFQEDKLEEQSEAPSREPELDGAIMPLPIPELTPEEKRRLEPTKIGNGEALSQVIPRGIPFGGPSPAVEEDSSPDELVLEEPLRLDFEGEESEDVAVEEPSEETSSNDWDSFEEGLEELNFDDSDDENLYDTDLGDLTTSVDDGEEDSFDEFAMIALGAVDEDDEENEEDSDGEDDFVLESLDEAKELDPFEEIAIMSSEDVAQYEPPFGENELKFVDDDLTPEDDPDPFLMDDDASDRSTSEELDPFGEEALSLSEATEDEADGEDSDDSEGASDSDEPEEKPKRKPKDRASKTRSGFSLLSILLIPWKLYSSFAGLVFGLLEGLIGVLAKIPILGIPFRFLGSLLAAIPLLLKKLLVLVLLIAVIWGGSSIMSGVLPKPSAELSLPDSGSARIFDVELKEGRITGQIENTGEITLQLFPDVLVSERKLLTPGTWFSPEEVGTCSGELVEIPIDATVKISYGCDLAVDGSSSLSPSLRE